MTNWIPRTLSLSAEANEALDRLAGPGARSTLVCELILERAAAQTKPTLLAQAKEAPEQTRAWMLGAMEMSGGNSAKARTTLETLFGISASAGSWRDTVDYLSKDWQSPGGPLWNEIYKRWPDPRRVSGREP